jgi:integrase
MIGTVEQYPTEAQAWQATEVLRLSINAANPSDGSVSFGAVVDRFLAEELPERTSTARTYRSRLQNHIKPKWGDCPIAEIEPLAVEQWLKGLPLASKTRRHIQNLMHILFDCAMRWKLIKLQKNPIDLVRVKDGSKRTRRPSTLTVEEFRRVIQLFREPYRTMCIVAGCLGLRISEVLGLQWSDFDWTKQQVRVQRSWVEGRVNFPKTEASEAWMPVDPLLAQVLFEHRHRTRLQSQWVFASPRTGRPLNPCTAARRWLVPAGEKAGVGRIGWHSFRHSYSTLLNELGTDLKVQQALLRHADIRTTMNVYTRAVPDRLRQANSRLVSVLLPTPKTA